MTVVEDWGGGGVPSGSPVWKGLKCIKYIICLQIVTCSCVSLSLSSLQEDNKLITVIILIIITIKSSYSPVVTEQQILVGSHSWGCIDKSVPRLLQDIFSEVLRIMWYFQLHSVEQVHDWPFNFHSNYTFIGT